MSTQPKKKKMSTLPSQISINIGILANSGLKTPFLQVLRKSVQRVKSYGPVKFWVKVMVRIV